MFKNFNRDDLEDLWKIVKSRFIKKDLVDDMDNLLLRTLNTMFEPQNIVYYLLVEKTYPLTRNTLHQLWNDVRLQVDYEVEMAYELLRLIRKQLQEGYMFGEYPAPQMAPVEFPQMVSSVKLHILKKGEYTLWSMRMDQYLTNTDYALWQVIINGDEPVQKTKDDNGVKT
ncbi:hypothetical protein Tco_1046886 [Tanacetum coccineum]